MPAISANRSKFREAEFSIQLSGEKILGIFTTRPYNDRY